MSKMDMRTGDRILAARKAGESGSDSEVLGVSGSLLLEVTVGRSRNSGFDISGVDGVLLMSRIYTSS